MVDRDTTIEQWFMSYGHDVYNFLVYYTGNRDVEDLVQEVFIKALKGLPRFEERASPKTWLFSIARRVAIDHERGRKVESYLPKQMMENDLPLDQTPEESLLLQEDIKHLYEVMRRLKRGYREVLLLRIIEAFSVAETAEILGWTKTRVNVTLHRALKALQNEHNQMEGDMSHAMGKYDR